MSNKDVTKLFFKSGVFGKGSQGGLSFIKVLKEGLANLGIGTGNTPGGLNDVLSTDNMTDRNIIFNKTLPIPTGNGQSETHNWFYFDNLAKTAPDGDYTRVPFLWGQKAVRQGGDSPTGKVNETMMWGWNLAPGGSSYIEGLPGIGYSLESNFLDAGQRLLEAHLFYVTPEGGQVRLFSYTNRSSDFVLDFYHTVSRFYLKLPEEGREQDEKQYFAISPSNTSANFSFGPDISGRDGLIKSITFEANFESGGGMSISAAGLLQKQLYSYGFTHWNLPGFVMARDDDANQTNHTIKGSSQGQTILNAEADNVVQIGVPNRRFWLAYVNNISGRTKSSAPVAGDLVDGTFSIFKNTTSGTVTLSYNDGGTIRSVTLT